VKAEAGGCVVQGKKVPDAISRFMIVFVKRDGFACNMDFGTSPVAVAGTITIRDPR
jgi:hypothetical protein